MTRSKGSFQRSKEKQRECQLQLLQRQSKEKGFLHGDQAGWHGKAPNDEQYAQAMEDLEKVGEALCQK